MKRTILMSICIGAVALSSACSRRDTAADDKKNILDLAARPAGSVSAVTVDGCLSATGDRFMLASLDKESSKTVVYQLINADDQLRNMIGKEVRVSGDAEPTQSAETREVTPATPAATSGSASDTNPDARVGTTTDTKLEVHKLSVVSVTASGDTCAK